MLPSDFNRKIQNILAVAEVVAVDFTQKPRAVKVQVNEGVVSDWMPFSVAFVGEAQIWAPPKIGTTGLVISEGGENAVRRFFPCFNNEATDPGMGSDDFLILLKNGDKIHHDAGSGTLTINSTSSVTVNTQKAEVNAPIITLNGDTTVTKSLTVQGFTSLNGGFAMNSGMARSGTYGTINIPVEFKVDPTINGTKYSAHTHKGVLAGGDNSGGVN